MDEEEEKFNLKKFLRNTAIGIVVLLLLFVGAGLAYTWYMGQNEDINAFAEPVEETPVKVVEHVMPADNTPESASVQSLTTPRTRGSNASITVRTKPFSTCTITAIYDKVASTDSGLITKDADDYGMVTWTWSISNYAPIGKWPVTVTCSYKGKSAVVVGHLEITN